MSESEQQAYHEWRRMVIDAYNRALYVHGPWRESFQNFWRDMGAPAEGQQLLLIGDSFLGYQPDNCLWG